MFIYNKCIYLIVLLIYNLYLINVIDNSAIVTFCTLKYILFSGIFRIYLCYKDNSKISEIFIYL